MVSRFSLDGEWELAGLEEGQGEWTSAGLPYPIPAPVPGEVHPALRDAGIIEDPFYGMNPDSIQWIEEKEWVYRRTFTLDSGFLRCRTFLEFDGLDTFGTVLLDGQEVG